MNDTEAPAPAPARSLERDHADDAAALAMLASVGATSETTARAYRRAAERFDQWAQERGVSPLDALRDRDTVAAFLVDQPTEPLSRLVQAVSALRLAARTAGLSDPCGAPARAILARLRSGEPEPGPDCCPACGFRLRRPHRHRRGDQDGASEAHDDAPPDA